MTQKKYETDIEDRKLEKKLVTLLNHWHNLSVKYIEKCKKMREIRKDSGIDTAVRVLAQAEEADLTTLSKSLFARIEELEVSIGFKLKEGVAFEDLKNSEGKYEIEEYKPNTFVAKT